MLSVCCVAFWFTRRANIFRGFVGNPERHEPWVNKSDDRVVISNQQVPNDKIGMITRKTHEV
jgi:hypothetical protein